MGAACRVPLGEVRGKPVQEKVGRARRVRRPRRRTRCLRHFLRASAGTGQAASEQRGVQRVQVGLAGKLDITATIDRPTAVLTGPRHRIGDRSGTADPAAGSTGMVRVRVQGSPLTAAAVLTWHGDLSRPLQQVLFDVADGITFDLGQRAG